MDNTETADIRTIYYDGVTKQWIVKVADVEVFRSEDYDVAFEAFARA